VRKPSTAAPARNEEDRLTARRRNAFSHRLPELANTLDHQLTNTRGFDVIFPPVSSKHKPAA
jgi:hypothetical protein